MTARQRLSRITLMTGVKVFPAGLAALGVAYLYSGLLMFVLTMVAVVVTVRRGQKEQYREPLPEKYRRLRQQDIDNQTVYPATINQRVISWQTANDSSKSRLKPGQPTLKTPCMRQQSGPHELRIPSTTSWGAWRTRNRP